MKLTRSTVASLILTDYKQEMERKSYLIILSSGDILYLCLKISSLSHAKIILRLKKSETLAVGNPLIFLTNEGITCTIHCQKIFELRKIWAPLLFHSSWWGPRIIRQLFHLKNLSKFSLTILLVNFFHH